jgi:cell wall-associated NlpC family hydrolase
MKLFFILLFFNITFGHAENLSIEAKRDSIVNYAIGFLGTPYLWGGTSPKGFDCSGFLYYVYKHFNIKVSRASSGYANLGKQIDLEKTQKGDILLFTGTNSTLKKIGHVGMVVKNEMGHIEFIHASSSKKHFGVTITSYSNSGYVKRFLKSITIL